MCVIGVHKGEKKEKGPKRTIWKKWRLNISKLDENYKSGIRAHKHQTKKSDENYMKAHAFYLYTAI